MASLSILNRGEVMPWRKKDFTVAEMEEMENTLRNSKLYLLKLSADDEDLSEKLGLKVEYVTNMADDNEAELIPIDDSNYYGLIRLRKELKKHKFAYIHEIIHYIFDVGYGNKVDECFFRKKKGKTNSHEEQRTSTLQRHYEQSETAVIRRIREVRKIIKSSGC